MTVVQYGDYFYLYLLAIALLPAIVLGCCGKNIKIYGSVISVIMIFLILGRSVGLALLMLFLLGEFLVILTYFQVRKKTDNRYVFWMFLFMSMLPLFIAKLSPFTRYGAIGFIGLSYLNFKAIQMVIEIYDGVIKEIKVFDLVYFFIFFPTLSSGPIDRSRRFSENINTPIAKDIYVNEYLGEGLKKILLAILYKFIIAYIIDTFWLLKIPTDITLVNSINYMYAYTLYLFFDFAGYSLFAVGTSYIIGVKTPDNFNKPFLSKDMKEFWTRWHISLSRWFGDYIFSRFVLNSMRKKRFKSRITASHVAQIITMFIMGLWHGITPYYILYGLYQGIVLVLTDMYQRKSKYYKKHKKEKWFQYVQIIITFNIASFGMLLFSGYLFK